MLVIDLSHIKIIKPRSYLVGPNLENFAFVQHFFFLSLILPINMRPFVRKSSKRAAMAVGLVVGTVYVLEALKIKKKVDHRIRIHVTPRHS